MSLSACDVLLNLVPALQVEILVNWLHLHDVAKLDSALCSSQRREVFSSILDEEHCVFKNIITRDDDNRYVRWIVRHNVKVSRVELTHHVSGPAARLKFLHNTGKHLHRLVASSNSFVDLGNVARDISTTCRNLETLVFCGNDLLKEDICGLLQHLPRLQHLDLSRCFNLTGAMLTNITTSTLHDVSLSECRMVKGALPEVQALGENHTIHTVTALQCPQIEIYLPFIYHCKALTMLYVNGIQRTDVFTILTQCPPLTTLSAGVRISQVNNPFSDDELHTLISLIQNLHVLHLYHENQILWLEGQVETVILGAPQLCVFFTAATSVTIVEIIAQSITDVHRLTEMFPVHCNTSQAYPHRLHTLLVDDISSYELQNILDICPQLVSLILQFGTTNFGYNSWDLMNTIGQSTIRILNVQNCEYFKSSDVLPLHNLVSLSLNVFPELKQCDVVQLLRQNSNLRMLALGGCKNLYQETLLHIMEMCNVLEELRFSNLYAGYSKFVNGPGQAINSTLIEGLIRLQSPGIKLSLSLQPELR